MRRCLPPVLTLVLALQACAGPLAPAAPGTARKPIRPAATNATASAKPAPTNAGAGQPTAPPALVAAGAQRVVAQSGDLALLTGKVKLLSDHGAALISNNGGGIIANNGGGVVANNGGGLVANNSAGYLARPLRLLQGAADEATLTDATVTVFDGAGRQLVDAQNKPLAAISDQTGGYRLQATLPAENLVLKVRLWNGGELSAILPRGGTGPREVAIDTAATLGASYVLSQFVKGDQATFDKLPASEVDRLRRDLDAARGLIGQTPDYSPAALVKLTDELRAKAPAVDKTLSDIKALLLGQANLGGGRQALDVPLGDPRSLLRLADGSLLVSESVFGRIRRIAPDGTITTWLDSIHGEKVKATWFRLSDMRLAADGSIYAADGGTFHLRKIAQDGTTSVVFGNGQQDGAIGATALETAVCPFGFALAADGTLYVGENYRPGGNPPRVMVVAPDGKITKLPAGPEEWRGHGTVSVELGADGTVWLLLRRKPQSDTLWRLTPGATSWSVVAADLELDKEGFMRLGPDGQPIVSENEAGRITRIGSDGTRTVLAGKGGPPGTAALAAPAGTLLEADGGMLIADGGANAVWRLKDGVLTRLAGALKSNQDGANGALAINGPGGVGFDSRGRMLIAEGGSHTIRRLDGTALETIAGGALGFAGDGGPATAAQFSTPTGLDVRGDVVWVLDSGNRRVRKIDAAGVITSPAGHYADQDALVAGVPLPPGEYAPVRPIDLAIGPDGLPAWTSIARHQVHRLRADGQVELVAGSGEAKGGYGGDGGPPGAARLDAPLGLNWGPDGSLYFADAGNMRIRRVSPDGKTIETFAGKERVETILGLAADTGAPTTRAEALLALPGGVCVDAKGNVFVGELGTVSIPLLASLTNGMKDLPVDALPKVTARVRKFAIDGTVTTIAGPGGKFFADSAAGDALIMPTGLAIDPQGRLVIVDGGANLIRFLPAGSY